MCIKVCVLNIHYILCIKIQFNFWKSCCWYCRYFRWYSLLRGKSLPVFYSFLWKCSIVFIICHIFTSWLFLLYFCTLLYFYFISIFVSKIIHMKTFKTYYRLIKTTVLFNCFQFLNPNFCSGSRLCYIYCLCF